MGLEKRCRQQFSSRDWQRGQDYFRHGAVSIRDLGTTYLEAEVQGSARRPYDVRLDWSETKQQTLLVHCSCPRFADVGLCKHVAAVILAADADGVGGHVPGKGNLFIEELGADIDEISDSTRYDFDEADRDDDRVGSLFSPSRLAKRTNLGWRKRLASLADLATDDFRRSLSDSGRPWSKPRQIWYVLDVTRTLSRGWPGVSLYQRPIKKDGTPGKLKAAKLTQKEADNLASGEDRTLIGLLAGNERDLGYGYAYNDYPSHFKLGDFAIAPAMFEIVLPRLCASGRFGWLPEGDDEVRPLAWDDGLPWKLRLEINKTSDRKYWEVCGLLKRGQTAKDLNLPLALLAAGLAVFPDRVARFDTGDEFRWTVMLRQFGPLLVPVKQEQEFVECLALSPCLPRADWPSELRWEEERLVPLPQLKISKSKRSWEQDLECRLTFQYGDRSVPFGGGQLAWYDRRTRRVLRRDLATEVLARDQLLSFGARRPAYFSRDKDDLFFISPAKLPPFVSQLTAAGWQVEAEGRVIRQAGQLSINVTSGVDWFDLEGTCDFGGMTASLPKLLSALRHGEQYVTLDDGSRGMLPNAWLARYTPLAELGQTQGDRLRFVPTQAALLDALLAAQDTKHVTVDKSFALLRDRLRSFDGIQPRREVKSFAGQLRQYQREGLGWLHFLDDFGFGGCLADDMGLGKTVQVLALLEERRQQRTANGRLRKPQGKTEASRAPSLVVVPRSLVFNWMEEARRFAPKLRVLNHTGLDRGAAFDSLNGYDLVVTTYGTLRRDIAKFRDFEFDYAILDEAQAVKNSSSQAAKACRLLRARRRLAMSGTPVENHLGELWSLFEFLNPGMLGRNRNLNQLFATGQHPRRVNGDARSHNEPPENLAILARALRPFLLRRTKQQVLSELPVKTEQTLYCELEDAERTSYEELREHYRRTLLERVSKVGVNKSKIHVLEALLRLRQAACHPGLLDKKRIDDGSSKLEILLEQLAEVVDEGHKALVFSQFTSLLAIVRRQLDRRNLVYEYLDGRTVKRQSKVERFQTDPNCRLFLISLKAGGQGLNLTAADYVFILDPWWNPAVEVQAVDRAHRIGQQRQVFAYRLIARDTVEEKILQLQEDKRGLAEAIISADNSLLRNLTTEDLQLLLS